LKKLRSLCYTEWHMTNPLPRHQRATSPPPFRLTPRDLAVINAVYTYRVLRRDQIQTLFFPSKNTANERLKRLYHHGYLARRWAPVEYGQGSGQTLYLLATKGAQRIAQERGADVSEIAWRRSQNHVSSPFLEHTLMINDVRLAIERAAERAAGRGEYQIETWLREEELKATPDKVWIETAAGRRRRLALVPDAYFRLIAGHKRASFFLEADRATETHGRWAQKVLCYLAYLRSGAYLRRYGSNCLRVVTVTSGERRLANLLRTTAQTCEGRDEGLFWFTTLERVAAETVLDASIWQVAGENRPVPLMAAERAELPLSGAVPQLLFPS
jgi:hypothetical protein